MITLSFIFKLLYLPASRGNGYHYGLSSAFKHLYFTLGYREDASPEVVVFISHATCTKARAHTKHNSIEK